MRAKYDAPKERKAFSTFPTMGRTRDGLVVFFTAKDTGFVVVPEFGNPIGYRSCSWVMDSFTELEEGEEVTLIQE